MVELFLSKFFWGTLLIGWGAIMIIEKLFKLNIPYGRFVFAFILIYAGVYLLTRHSSSKKVVIEKRVFNTETVCDNNKLKEYNITFGESVIDLSANIDYTKPIRINTVFGTTEVFLADNETYEIKVNTVFGETQMPLDKTVNFGTNHYIIGSDSNENKIKVEINTVFGNTKVVLKLKMES